MLTGARRIVCLVVASALSVAASGAGGRPPALWAAGVGMPKWMTVDAAHKRVSMIVTAADGGANGTYNFNGYGTGQLTVTVPVGWQVHIDFVNGGAGTLPHSLEVIRPVHPLPNQGIDPAILRAATNDLIDGITPHPPNNKDTLDFTVMPAGTYLWFCGFPTHGRSGMWDYFIVSSSATLPSVTVKK